MSTFGGLYVGSSGLKSSQNALNTTSHNLVNANTKGYTRQQVYLADLAPNTVGASSISMMQAGLGASFDEARQVRDVFLDKSYRTESGRQSFYEAEYASVREIELYFGELEGVAFQDSLLGLYQAFEEWDKIPDDTNNLDFVILRSTEFLERAASVYEGIKEYQKDINHKITQQVDSVNKIGKQISDLNKEILSIEAAGVEKANDLRDTRNALIDELSSYINVEVEQQYDGVLFIRAEGELFVDRVGCNVMDTYKDNLTDFLVPVWPHLAVNGESSQGHPVFNFSHGIHSDKNSDIGSLKAMILSRGESNAKYSDLEGLSQEDYQTGLQMNTMMNAEAELDRLVHRVVTGINDYLSPLKTITDDIGHTYRVWDEEKGALGASKSAPGEELFVRNTTDRYKEMTLTVDGVRSLYYVYNEEALGDFDTMYTISNLSMNEKLLEDETLLPHLKLNGEVDYGLTQNLVEMFNERSFSLNPNDTTKISILEYYQNMINMFATEGQTYKSKEETVSGTVTSITNKRQQVVGVSSDEELTNMIKYQNAYNASSRYINVVNEMIEHLLTRL